MEDYPMRAFNEYLEHVEDCYGKIQCNNVCRILGNFAYQMIHLHIKFQKEKFKLCLQN